jgi:hypothetical protein
VTLTCGIVRLHNNLTYTDSEHLLQTPSVAPRGSPRPEVLDSALTVQSVHADGFFETNLGLFRGRQREELFCVIEQNAGWVRPACYQNDAETLNRARDDASSETCQLQMGQAIEKLRRWCCTRL